MNGPLTADEPKLLVAAPASVCEAKNRMPPSPQAHKHCPERCNQQEAATRVSPFNISDLSALPYTSHVLIWLS